MSMMITTSTPTAAPPVPGNIAQGIPAAPALPGADAAAAFADFMNGGLAAVPADDGAAADADAEAPAADNAAATPEQAATDVLVQEEQQALVSMQSMMLSMPLTMAMPVPVPMAAAQALPVVGGEAAAPAADAVVSATVAAGSGSAVAPLGDAQAAAAPAQPQQAVGAAAQPAFAATLGQATAASAAPAAPTAPTATAAPAAPAAIVTDAPVAAADAPAAPVTGASATSTAPVAAATSELKLAAATPAAWQQPLREALGDRLQLQLSRNVDQAVIRLDPPNLGRIEIAIRHMAGALEVNISATHSEVVRQLHTISDTMRTDLAQRQFGEVAVNVTTATRNAAGAQQAFDQQGRQRQQDGAAEESDPGRALAEAGNPSSTFSLNARESYA